MAIIAERKALEISEVERETLRKSKRPIEYASACHCSVFLSVSMYCVQEERPFVLLL